VDVNLYSIQDSDRPMWVVAADWADAVREWKERMAYEGCMSIEDVEECDGITLVCNEDDLILPVVKEAQ
jgi:hypothetical protein